MSEKALAVTTNSFQDEVLNSDQPVLVDFWATWCSPCKMLSPLVDQIADEYAGKLKVTKIDADENGDIAMRYQVQGLPTLALFKNGQLVERIVGYKPKAFLVDKIAPHLG